MSDLKFVEIETVKENEGSRSVSLSYNWKSKPEKIILLGNLSHNTQIVVNQELVDNLQKIVDYLNNLKEIK